jgi:hypothetical protein
VAQCQPDRRGDGRRSVAPDAGPPFGRPRQNVQRERRRTGYASGARAKPICVKDFFFVCFRARWGGPLAGGVGWWLGPGVTGPKRRLYQGVSRSRWM